MLKTPLKTFFIKLLLFSTPFLIFFLCAYLVDPYKVFSPLQNQYNYTFPINDRYLKAKYLAQTDKHGHNAFIFGSSIAHAFKADDLNQSASATGLTFYNYSALGESIYGIEKKLQFLLRLGFPIKGILVILDPATISRTSNRDALIFRESPIISGETYSSFAIRYLSVFFSPIAVKDYIQYGRRQANFLFTLSTGDHDYITWDQQLQADPEEYYRNKWLQFKYEADSGTTSSEVIGEDQKRILMKIQDIIDKNHIQATFVVPPLYTKQKIAEQDLIFLRSLFLHVEDYSGVNSLTRDAHNYYDPDHFRQNVAEIILKDLQFNNN